MSRLTRRRYYDRQRNTEMTTDAVNTCTSDDFDAFVDDKIHTESARRGMLIPYSHLHEELDRDNVAFVQDDDGCVFAGSGAGSVSVRLPDPEPDPDYYDPDLSSIGSISNIVRMMELSTSESAAAPEEKEGTGIPDAETQKCAVRMLGQHRIHQYLDHARHLQNAQASKSRLNMLTVEEIAQQRIRTRVARQMPSRQFSNFWRSQVLADTSRVKYKKYRSWKYKRAKQWHKDKQAIVDFFGYFKLWSGSMKAIEGSFGSSVASYFQFIRWLFLLNIFIFLCILGVIILPQALLKPHSFEESIQSENVSLTSYQEMAVVCSENYTSFVEENTKDDITSVVVDVFQGTGILQDTYLFLGYYFNKTYFADFTRLSYDLPLAHLLSTAGYLIITLILMVRYTANGLRERILSKGYSYHKCLSLVFCGWDYTLTKKKAASYKHMSLAKEIMTVLLELDLAEKLRAMNRKQKACIYLKRIIINIITIVCLGGCFTLIYYVVEVWKPKLQETKLVADNGLLTLVVEYLPSVTITVLNVIIPFIFSYLVILEEYAPSTELNINLIRSVFLRLSSLVMLAVTMFRLIKCSGQQDVFCGSCNEKIKCWETYIGQELYKLVILDFFVILGTTFLVEFPRKYVVTKVKKLRVFQQEFDLPVNVLNIVYLQTLCWWGAFYSPLIPAMTIVKLFILFYCKKVSLFVNQTPPHRPYRTSKSNHLFMVILMVSFVMSVAALTYTIGWLIPSQGCSPFRVYIVPDYRLYSSVTAAVSALPSGIRIVFTAITSWLAYGLMLVILSLVIYFLRSKAAGSERVINILQNHFALLEKDKKFLLDEVRQVPQI